MEILNSKEDLRPIGTEFEHTFDPDETSSGLSRFTIWKYRVKAHVLCSTYMGGAKYWAEQLELLSSRYEAAIMVWDHGVIKYLRESDPTDT